MLQGEDLAFDPVGAIILSSHSDLIMDFPVFLNKWIIGFKPIKGSSFYYWFRLINHSDYRLDDHIRAQDFWWSINGKV